MSSSEKRPSVEGPEVETVAARSAAERSTAFERALASASHAVATPLQVIAGRASLIVAETNDPAVVEHAAIIERKVRELSDFLRRFLEFARGANDHIAMDLPSVVQAEIEALRASANVTFEVGTSEAMVVEASEELLRVAIASVLEEMAAVCHAGDVISSSIFRAEGRVHWRLGVPRPVASVWTASSHETWMGALDSRGQARERVLRQGIALGALKRLGAAHQVRQDEALHRWDLTITFSGSDL